MQVQIWDGKVMFNKSYIKDATLTKVTLST